MKIHFENMSLRLCCKSKAYASYLQQLISTAKILHIVK